MTTQEYCRMLINNVFKVTKNILYEERSSDGKTLIGYRLRIVITEKFLKEFQRRVEPKNALEFEDDPKFYELLSDACKKVLTSPAGIKFFEERFGIQLKERTTIIVCRKNVHNNDVMISSNLFKKN